MIGKQPDVMFIGMVAQEKMEVIINDRVIFDYNRTKHQLKIWISSKLRPYKKLLFDEYEINIYNMEYLKQYAAQYFLEYQSEITKELNGDTEELTLIPYEKQGEMITGYQVYLNDEQIATLEYRCHEWIGAVFIFNQIIQLKNVDQEKVYEWIKLMVL